jgi:ketosteroid isomerase-like protein
MSDTEIAGVRPSLDHEAAETRAAALVHLIEAFRGGDLATLQRSMAPDVELVAEGKHPYAGVYRGYASALAFVARTAHWIDLSSLRVEGVEAEPEFTVSLTATVRPAQDKTMRAGLKAAFHFDANDRISKAIFWADDQEALDEFLTRYAASATIS